MKHTPNYTVMPRIACIIAIAAAIGFLTGCASLMPPPNWDSATPKGERVVLYYPEDFQVEEVNGESKSVGPVSRVYTGNGGNWERSKRSLQVPPGATNLRIAYTGGMTTIYTSVSYNFLPGGHYRLIPAVKEGTTLRDLMRTAIIGTNQDFFDWKVEKIR